MKFQIKSDGEYDKNKDKIYSDFLLKSKKNIPSVVWNHFSNDFFFHDGKILNIAITPYEAIIKIQAPNFKIFKTSDDFEFMIIEFVCEFKNIYFLDVENLNNMDYNYISSDMYFISSEIDTIPRIENIRKDGKSCNSLILRTNNDNGDDIMISLIFGELKIFPVEPLACEVIKNNKNLVVPEPLS